MGASASSRLITAVDNGDLLQVQQLLEQGANANVRINDDGSTLHLACQQRSDFLRIAKVILDHGADLNVNDHFGWTPLHWAAWNNHLETAKLLVRNGANLHIQENGEGWTPPHTACHRGNLEILRVMLERYQYHRYSRVDTHSPCGMPQQQVGAG